MFEHYTSVKNPQKSTNQINSGAEQNGIAGSDTILYPKHPYRSNSIINEYNESRVNPTSIYDPYDNSLNKK